MDAINWRPAQGSEPTVDTGDWRSQLQPDLRQRIVNKMMETLKRHLPFSGQEGLQELKKIAVRFEEKMCAAATSQTDYLRKISSKMQSMEVKSQGSIAISLPPNSAGSSTNNQDSESNAVQSQVVNQGQQIPMQMGSNQDEVRQQVLSQSIQSNIVESNVPSSASLTSTLPPVCGLPSTAMPIVVGQNSHSASIQIVSGISQNSFGNSLGQGVSWNMFANSQKRMQGIQPVVSAQQQPSQNPQHYLYPQQIHQQLLKQKYPQGSVQHSVMQSHMQQQPQQNVPQSTQLQPSMMQSASLVGPYQSQQSSVQHSHPGVRQNLQSVFSQQQLPRETSMVHQQQTPMQQQSILSMQRQLIGRQPNSINIQPNQLIQQQPPQGLLGQLNSLSNLEQQQQCQLMGQANNLHTMHQQQMVSQNNVAGLQQQQQLLETQYGSFTMQTNQHSVHMLQQSMVPLQQQTQQGVDTLLPNQGQQSHSQPLSQHSMTQIQSHRAIPEASSTSQDSAFQTGNASSGDWQEEIYEKIKAMKESYLPELTEMYEKIAGKLQQHEALPQQPKEEELEKLKVFKAMLGRIIFLLQIPKSNILPGYKDMLASFEKQIISVLNPNRPRKPGPTLPQGQQLPPSWMHSMQQSKQQLSQITQMQPRENQMNTQLQLNLPSPVAPIKQNNMTGLQQNSLSSFWGIPVLSQGKQQEQLLQSERAIPEASMLLELQKSFVHGLSCFRILLFCAMFTILVGLMLLGLSYIL